MATANVVHLIIRKLRRKGRQQTLPMPNRLETTKMQNEADQTEELGNGEDACPILLGGGEVSNSACKASPR